LCRRGVIGAATIRRADVAEQKQVIVPDSPEVRRLAALGSLNADLTEAALALELASEHAEADNDNDRALYRQLIAHAVVVYGRDSTDSGKREALRSFVAVPASWVSTHDQVMNFRNRTIAHSESTNEATYVLAELLEDDGVVTVGRILAATTASPPPHQFVQRFRALIKEMQILLKAEIEVARVAVLATIDAQQAGELWGDGEQPQLVPGFVSDWDPSARRPAYPSSHEILVHLFDGEQP
jgi:hypothetical protein